MSEADRRGVEALRAALERDEELADLPRALYSDDELLRHLDSLGHDVTVTVESLRTSWRGRAKLALPVARELVDSCRWCMRLDGTARTGERALLIIMSRALQEALLKDEQPFIMAVVGLMESLKAEAFEEGVVESVQTIVMVERGFRLSLQSVPIAATQRLMGIVTEIYPSYTSRILIVNLPGYLSWFVRFVKGFLCEASASKIEVVTDYGRLLDFFDEQQLPSYFRDRKSIKP